MSQVSPTTQSNETQLINDLLTGYSRFTRPVLDLNHPVTVTFGFELIQLLSISEADQTITMKVWMRMNWYNELLKWDMKKYGNVTVSKLNRETVWTPDIFLQEDITEDMSSGPTRYETPVAIRYTGKHTWLIPVLITSSCLIDVTDFPFDQQICKFKFVSWTHDQTELDIRADSSPVVTSNYINSSTWTLLGVKSKVVSVKYNCCPNPYVDIRYELKLNRKPSYYVFNVVIPCIIQMIIILFTFFLPPDSGERIGVVITVILVFAVYLEVVSSSLPKTSTTKPTLSHFYVTAMAESAFSLIATCFVLVIHFKGTEKGVPPMPAWIRRLFIDTIAPFVWVRINLREYSNEGLLALQEKFEESDGEPDMGPPTMETLISEVRVITKLIHDQNRQDEIEEEWQILAKVFDRLFFLAFLFIFIFSSLVILVPVYVRQIEKSM